MNVERNLTGKTLHVLRTMADGPDQYWGVRELARMLHMSPSRIHRILALLEHERLVSGDSMTGHRLSLEFFRFASRASASFPFRRAAVPVMQELVRACNETALLGLYDPTRMEMAFVASVESSHQLRYMVELNKWLPVYAGASGLAIMAFLPEEERRAIIARTKLIPLTERTITNPDKLEKEMTKIRRQGYACTRGQRTPGAAGIAAPIWDIEGRVSGDLILTIPEQRFSPRSQPNVARLLVKHANLITEQIGGRLQDMAYPLHATKPKSTQQVGVAGSAPQEPEAAFTARASQHRKASRCVSPRGSGLGS